MVLNTVSRLREYSFATQNIDRDPASVHQIEAKLMAILLHELRNPLATIALSAEQLEEEETIAQKQKHLERIQAKVKQITHLLENITLLLYSDSEKFISNLEYVDLVRLCTDLIEEVKFSTDIHRFAISYRNQDQNYKGCNWAHAWIDQSLFTRSLINLLSNAIKYSPDGGEITLAFVRQADHFTFKIRDPGLGIAPEDLPFVFDWFYRGSHPTPISGSGLGLAIARQCIELHQGTISIQSQIRGGTEITIHIPVRMSGG
jgi:two-component system, OmpR family, phosphate regulon sensor histidine kinase PhoR